VTWRFATTPSRALPDSARFLARLNAEPGFFDPAQPLIAARAPGRLDLMGGIADYSGSLVLELPLDCAAWAAAQWTGATTAEAISANAGEVGGAPRVGVPLADLLGDYATVRARLAHLAADHWAAYVLGALTVLHAERGLPFERGLRLFVASEVPVGKGVSSSAAIEVAAMRAICGLLDLELDGRALALLCQKVENLVVGAPCGVMDQMTAACGQPNSLLALLCQPAELEPGVELPSALEVWGIDSGIRHAVSGADYGSVRVGAFMGYAILAAQAGLLARPAGPGRVTIADPRWQGYLANLTPSVWEARFRDRVPETLTGAAFLAEFGGFTDAVTTIDPAHTYAVRQPAAHPIYEHHRVMLFRALLQKQNLSEADCRLLGELMYQSHLSYSACGLDSTGTDRLVELVRAVGPETGLYGAKITGGGSGGTVAVLARRGSAKTVETLAAAYARETGRTAHVLGGSSPGALVFGAHPLKAD
jgi:L-arabinokinase